MLKKSMPARVNAAAIRIASSGSTPAPSGRISSNDMRMPTTKSSPTAARTAAITSSGNRMRFSIDPPYSSSRWFRAGVRNSSSRWPAQAEISTPSRPPALQRNAASAKSRATRSRSWASATRVNARCAGSRVPLADSAGTQSWV